MVQIYTLQVATVVHFLKPDTGEFFMRFRNLVLLAAGMVFSLPAWADTYKYNLASGNGMTGTEADYTVQGTTLKAFGFLNGNGADLFFKHGGSNETGLGLAAMANFEISGNGFTQFHPNHLLMTDPTSIAFTFGSVSPGEVYNIWGSNSFGTKGTLLGTGSANSLAFNLPDLGSYRFISVTAESGNVLVDTITTKTAGVPEPGAGSLLTMGLIAIGAAGIFFRRAAVPGLRYRIAF